MRRGILYAILFLAFATLIFREAYALGDTYIPDEAGDYVYCWGNNNYGQADDYNATPSMVIQISAGELHNCALLEDGTVHCWGSNYHGESNDYNGFLGKAVQVSAGNGYTCALLEDGTVHCWGYNGYGQAEDYNGFLGKAIQVSAGYYHTCALLEDGTVHCWGSNSYGQSEDYNGFLGKAVQVSAGYLYTCALLEDGNIHCWGSDSYGQSEDYNGFLGKAVQVSAGRSHTCALLEDGNIHCWGSNSYGQSEDYNGFLGKAVQVSAGYLYTCALLEDGNVHCWGYNASGQANDYNGFLGKAVQVSTGGGQSCALIQNNAPIFADVYITDENLTTIPLEIELTHDENYIINTTFCPADPNDVVILFDLSGPDHVSYGGKITINNWGCGSIVIGRFEDIGYTVQATSNTPVEVLDYSGNQVTFYLGDPSGAMSPGPTVRFYGSGLTNDVIKVGGPVVLSTGTVFLTPGFYTIMLFETATRVDVLGGMEESYFDPYVAPTYLYTCSHYMTTIVPSPATYLETNNCVGGYTGGSPFMDYIYYTTFKASTVAGSTLYFTQDTNISYIWFDATADPITFKVGNYDVVISNSRLDGFFVCLSTGGKIYIDSTNDYNNATFDSTCDGVVVFGSPPSGGECTEINTTPYTITSGGCYVLATDVFELYIDYTVPTDANVSIDLNGHTVYNVYVNSTPNLVEIYNGALSYFYGSAKNVYIHDLNSFGYLNFAQSNSVKLHNASGGTIEYAPFWNTSYIEFNNVSLSGDLVLNGVQTVDMYNMSFSNRVIFDVNTLNVSNSTYAGYPLIAVNTPAEINADGAYFVKTPSGSVSDQYYIALFATPSAQAVSVDFNGSHVHTFAVNSASEIYNVTIDKTSNYTHIHRADNVTILDTYDGLFIPADANITNSTILAPYQSMDIYPGFYADANTIFGAQYMYLNGAGTYMGRTFKSGTVYLYPTYDLNNIVPYVFNFTTITGYPYASIYFFPSDYDIYDINEIIFNVDQIGDQNTPITLQLDGGWNGATYIFNNTKIYGTIICTGTVKPTLVFNNADLTYATIDQSCTNVQIEKPNLYITTSQTHQEVEEGQSVEFNVVVTAYGAPVDNVVVRAFADNYYDQFDQNAEYVIPHIDENQSVTVTFEFNLGSSPATYRLYAVVDPDNAIDESDETDNNTRDTTGTYFYVNVVRYISSCGTLYTGQYKLTTHITDANTDCFYVPNGENVHLDAGAGLEAADIETTVVRNAGSLTVWGIWGRGKIVNEDSGYLYLGHVSPSTSDGFYVYNRGTLHIEQDCDIKLLVHESGTVYIYGPDVTLRSYIPVSYTSNPNMQLVVADPISRNIVYDGYETDGPVPIYADVPVTNSDGMYVFLNYTPVFDSVPGVRYLVVSNGIDFSVSNKDMYSLQINAVLGDATEANLASVEINGGVLEIRNGPNYDADNGVRHDITFDNSSINVDNIKAEYSILRLYDSTVHSDVTEFVKDVDIHVEGSELDLGDVSTYMSGSVAKFHVDVSSAPTTISASSVSVPIEIYCTGPDNWLYLSDTLLESNYVTIDQSCYWSIDYNRNVHAEFLESNITVQPDSNYSVTVRVYNDGSYSTLDGGVQVVLYFDGIQVAQKTTDPIPPNSYVDVTFTLQAPVDVGAHELYAVVDPADEILEANESDNTATATVNVTTESAPSGGAAAPLAATGIGGLTASTVHYISAKIGEVKETVLHIYWEYGYETTATLVYVNINGEIEGPEKVRLRIGDNKIPVKVKVGGYGEVGKVIVYAVGKKQEITIYAKPLAQLNIPTGNAMVLLLIVAAAYLLAKYFAWI